MTAGDELTAVLHRVAHQTAHRLRAVVAVYLLTPDGEELRAAMIGGGPPAMLSLTGRMFLDSPYASACALASRRVGYLADPDPLTGPEDDALPYPYTAASAPLLARGVAVRFPDRAAHRGPGRIQRRRRPVARAARRTARRPAGPPARTGRRRRTGRPARSGPVVRYRASCPGRPGCARRTRLHRDVRSVLPATDMLNRATTMERFVAAADLCLLAALGARALILASAAKGRLWVLDHSGDSLDRARELHGAALHAATPAIRALRGRALFVTGGPRAGRRCRGTGRGRRVSPPRRPSARRGHADGRTLSRSRPVLSGVRRAARLPGPC